MIKNKILIEINENNVILKFIIDTGASTNIKEKVPLKYLDNFLLFALKIFSQSLKITFIYDALFFFIKLTKF